MLGSNFIGGDERAESVVQAVGLAVTVTEMVCSDVEIDNREAEAEDGKRTNIVTIRARESKDKAELKIQVENGKPTIVETVKNPNTALKKAIEIFRMQLRDALDQKF